MFSDPATKTITLPAERAEAMANVAAHYVSLFGNDPATAELREAYAMRENTVDTLEHRRALTAFFWWTAWAAGTERHTEQAGSLVEQVADLLCSHGVTFVLRTHGFALGATRRC